MSLAVTARVLLLALAAAAPPPAPEPTGAAETVLWFGSAAPGIDGVALLNAVTVYTRDLRLAVEAAAPTPPPASAADAAGPASVLRARRARLGFWCAAGGARRTVVITTIDRAGRIESHTIEETPADEPDLYRAIALKLRTVVVAAVGTEVLTARGPPARPPTSSAETVNAAAESAATARPPSSAPSPRVFFSLGYLFSAPLGTAPLRSAVSGEAALRLGRAGELAFGVELAPRATANAGSGSVSVFDLPLALGARLVTRRARWAAGGGAFLAAHLLWASGVATDDGGATGSSFSVTAGVGVEALARLRLGGGFAGALRAYAEETIPNTWYLVRETPTLEIGPRVGLGLGLVFPAAF